MSMRFSIPIPDAAHAFRGSAAQLAELCNRLLVEVGIEQEAVANERLIRHYVSVDVLSPPVRQGREAVYGVRHVAEFLLARKLLRDGWPLAKIAELVKTCDLPVPAPDAEGAVSRIPGAGVPPVRAASAPPPVRQAAAARSRLSAGPRSVSSDSLSMAADLAARRMDLSASLRALGNLSGAVERSERVELRLTPWVTVSVEADALRRLGVAEAGALGQALADALLEAKTARGDGQ